MNALGSGYRWSAWKEGGEGAFTLIPNFLVTGIMATFLGLLMILWALCFIQKEHGPAVFLLLGITSFLTGGGVAQVLLFTITWGFATRIRAPLTFSRWLIPPPMRPTLGYVPGVTTQMQLLHICWTILGIALSFYILSILSGFAHDIEKNPVKS